MDGGLRLVGNDGDVEPCADREPGPRLEVPHVGSHDGSATPGGGEKNQYLPAYSAAVSGGPRDGRQRPLGSKTDALPKMDAPGDEARVQVGRIWRRCWGDAKLDTLPNDRRSDGRIWRRCWAGAKLDVLPILPARPEDGRSTGMRGEMVTDSR